MGSAYLLPLLSAHLPFLLFVCLIPDQDLLDTFRGVLGTGQKELSCSKGNPHTDP